MRMRASGLRAGRVRRRLLAAACLFGALLVGVPGWLLVRASLAAGETHPRRKAPLAWLPVSLGETMARMSYDISFVLRGSRELPEARIVYLDEGAAAALGQRGGVWDRRLHAALVRRLTQEGARAILFDIVFADASAVDAEFAEAIAAHGRVFLGGALEIDAGHGAMQARVVAPTQTLRRAAAGWGLLAFQPVDADYGVRRLFLGTEDVPVATWVAAEKLGAPLGARAHTPPLWLHYYGPADDFPSVSLDRALAANGVPAGFFRDQLVVVGGRSTLDVLMLGKDEFRTPFGRLGGPFARGVEIHLTAWLNLLRADSLRRMPAVLECWAVALLGVLLGGALPRFRPLPAFFVCGLIAGGVLVGAQVLFIKERIWFAWAIPVMILAPAALIWAVGTRYFIEERRRRSLREAFARYLSPHLADRIADADISLAPGGVLVEATVLFTDLENFTALCERIDDPEQVSEVLVGYFSRTCRHVLENDGTIIRYAGDAIQAAWGAPLPEPAHARKAVLAAWKVHLAASDEIAGFPLRTRIGVHTGRVLAGNLGSRERFDYAVIGDTVNFASRLEGLNKYLGTSVLLSEEVLARLDGTFVTRCVGSFRVQGKRDERVVHELIGPSPQPAAEPWREAFAGALAAFRRGAFAEAGEGFRETIALRDGRDGPSEFYLARLAQLDPARLPEPWTGVLEFDTK